MKTYVLLESAHALVHIFLLVELFVVVDRCVYFAVFSYIQQFGTVLQDCEEVKMCLFVL